MLLEVRNVYVSYGRIKALWDITVGVDKGEVVALIGANGAGKSSLLRSIMGLVPVEKGTIWYDGRNITFWKPWDRARLRIGFVPEGARVFPDLTVEENLVVGGLLIPHKSSVTNAMQRVFELFPVLKERKRQLARTLSGGERQMLSIGRALMTNPTLLLVDEISLGLMPIMVEQVFSILAQLNSAGITIFLAEQNVREALSLATRGYVLENGRIRLAGTAEELRENKAVKRAYLGL